MHPWAWLPLAIISEMPFKNVAELCSPSNWPELSKTPPRLSPEGTAMNKRLLSSRMSTSVHTACPEAASYWLELCPRHSWHPHCLASLWTLDTNGSEFQEQGPVQNVCRATAWVNHAHVRSGQFWTRFSLWKHKWGHRATKANEKKSLERERYQEGHQPRPGAGDSPWRKSQDRPHGTQEGQPWSSDYIWAFPDVSAFAPESLKIMNVSHRAFLFRVPGPFSLGSLAQVVPWGWRWQWSFVPT